MVRLFCAILEWSMVAKGLREEMQDSFTQSNAEQALPSVANLFEQGVVGEAICAIDTLVYGCAGGSQPACGP